LKALGGGSSRSSSLFTFAIIKGVDAGIFFEGVSTEVSKLVPQQLSRQIRGMAQLLMQVSVQYSTSSFCADAENEKDDMRKIKIAKNFISSRYSTANEKGKRSG